jgi:hypothetical protein
MVLLLLLLLITNVAGSACAVITIPWRLPASAHNVSASAGDIVAFDFTTGHTVVRMPSAAALASCDFSASTTFAGTGPVGFRMPNVTALYFACSVSNHCAQGMQVAVLLAPNATSTPTSAPTNKTTPSTALPTEIITSSPSQNGAAQKIQALWPVMAAIATAAFL